MHPTSLPVVRALVLGHRLAFGFTLAVLFMPITVQADYQVTVRESDPLVADARLQLPRGNGESRTLVLRGVSWGLDSQVFDVCGEKGSLPKSGPGEWTAPADCYFVHWKIRIREATPGTVNGTATLPAAFVTSLRTVIGPEIDRLVQRYVGG